MRCQEQGHAPWVSARTRGPASDSVSHLPDRLVNSHKCLEMQPCGPSFCPAFPLHSRRTQSRYLSVPTAPPAPLRGHLAHCGVNQATLQPAISPVALILGILCWSHEFPQRSGNFDLDGRPLSESSFVRPDALTLGDRAGECRVHPGAFTPPGRAPGGWGPQCSPAAQVQLWEQHGGGALPPLAAPRDVASPAWLRCVSTTTL